MDERLARRLLALLVLVSFAARSGLAWLQATPLYFPDEYLYSSLSRSLVETGRPLVRGGSAHLPSLLVPLLEAPAWLAGSVDVAYRLLQAEQSLAISLAALPVYWLARRLGVDRGRALAAAGLALLVPDLVFSSFLLGESFALPLFLAAVCAGLAALERGGRRRWTLFAALALLATSARIQFVFLVPLVLIAGIWLEGRRGRRAAAARLGGALLALAVPLAVAAAVAGPARVLGRYDGVLDVHGDAGTFAAFAGFNGIVLALASGWVVVPGAVLALARGLARPRSRLEEAFAAVTALALVVLLGQATLFAAGGLQVMERYSFYASPLLLVGFALAWQRGLLATRAHAALALALGGVGLLLPRFTQLFFSQPDHAPALLAYAALHRLLEWRAPLAFAAAAAALAAAALALGRSRRARPLVALAAAVGLALTAGARLQLHDTAAAAARQQGGGLSFVDATGARDASYLVFANTAPAAIQQLAFWNRSVDRVLRLTASGGDGFASVRARPARDGRLLVDGRPLADPLVVDRGAAFVRFDRPPVARIGSAELVPPDAELRELVDGYVADGRWLAASGTFEAWPATESGRTRGSLVLRLWSARRSLLRLEGPGCDGTIAVTRTPRLHELRFDTLGPWRCRFSVAGTMGLVDGHLVAVHADVVRFSGSLAAVPRTSDLVTLSSDSAPPNG